MTALLLVDIQNDFFPGGPLGISGADEILPIVQQLIKLPFNQIIATKDWHPENHGSFASTHNLPKGSIIELDGIPQILWPKHCIQNTQGAAFHKGWDSQKVDKIFFKGIDPIIDSYSTFFDNEKRRSTGLEDYLKKQGITTLYIAGVATDYCVKYSVLDAKHLNFDVYVILDACKGIELLPGDIKKSYKEMQDAGAHLILSKEVKVEGKC